ncbi:uncharacterized protein LOC110185813 isoform X2 [Drosophila serrata]|uniref:uncharacterized protein LOC110185813 isoform X2 n=1 Tax=Drosophila serrata TaxID=7274 RepID=UPI000A1D3176|nr:uncharacterized protein LOC110185813 isoform X2 [Drosophila serrata]
MDAVCRLCLLGSNDMLNIIDGSPESGVSIANIVAQYTGCEVKRGDSLPETICSLCLQDARNWSQLACQKKNADPDSSDELLEEQVCEVTDGESEAREVRQRY